MNYAIVENDLITRVMSGDLVVPEGAVPFDFDTSSVPASRLVWDGEAIVDAATLESFFVGPDGRKYAVDGDGRQPLDCHIDDRLVLEGEAWRVASAADDLTDLKAMRIADLTDVCAAAVISGYVSAALGEAHTYPSKITDQINMMGSVTASLLPEVPEDWLTPFWCQDSEGEWAFRPHSAEQIQQAGADGKQYILDCQAHLAALSVEVTAAATVEAVLAIVWEVA